MRRKLVLLLVTIVAATVSQAFWVSPLFADSGLSDFTDAVLTEGLPREKEYTSDPENVAPGISVALERRDESVGATSEVVVPPSDQLANPPESPVAPLKEAGKELVEETAKNRVGPAVQRIQPIVEPLNGVTERASGAADSLTQPALTAVERVIANSELDEVIPRTDIVRSIDEAPNEDTASALHPDSVDIPEAVTPIGLEQGVQTAVGTSEIVETAADTPEAIIAYPLEGLAHAGRMESVEEFSPDGGLETILLRQDRVQYQSDFGRSLPDTSLSLEPKIPDLPVKSGPSGGNLPFIALEPALQAPSNSSRIDWPEPVWVAQTSGLLAMGILLALHTYEARPRTLHPRPSTPPA